MPHSKLIHAGARFTRLIVLESFPSPSHPKKLTVCKVRCDCGKEFVAPAYSLRNNHTKSCGCLHTDRLRDRITTHGQSRSPLYRVWIAMVRRCHCPNDNGFQYYGGRGIEVCKEWRESVEQFFADMGPRPAGSSIDRINNDGHYEPGNCRWATTKEQSRNRRNNRFLTIRGRTLTIADWVSESGVDRGTVFFRLKRGWSAESAVFTPPT